MAAGSARRSTAATPGSTPTLITLRYNGTRRPRSRRADRRRAGRLGPALHDRARPRARRRPRRLPDQRPLLRLRPHQRGLPDVSRIVVKVGGAVADGPRRAGPRRSPRPGTRCASSTAPARRSREEMERAGPPGRVRRRPARDDAGGARDRARVASPRSTRPLRGDRARAVPLFGDEIGLHATQVPALGLVGDPLPSRPAGGRGGARRGPDPGRRAARRRAAEHERRRGGRRARARARRRATDLPHRRRRASSSTARS